MTPHELAAALVRTTLATSAAACLAVVLLGLLKVQSPRTHRVAWLLVILQGWLLFPWTLRLEAPPAPPQSPRAMPSSSWAWTEAELLPTDQITIVAPPAEPPRRFADVAVPATLAAWLAGAALVAVAAAWRYVRILRTLPLGAAPDDPQWQAEWRRARQGLAPIAESAEQNVPVPCPRVDLRITESLGPLLAFIPWRYLILAPRTLWTALASPEREAILRHELAHLRRRDLWKSLALRTLALPQWFNPFVRLAVRRFDEAAEWACDAEAAGADATAPLTLAQSLVRSAELLQSARAGAPGAVPFQGGVLSRRIHRLVTPRFKEESTMKRLAVPVLLAGIAAAQLIRIERVAASDPPPSQGGARGGIPDAASSPSEPESPTEPMTIAEWMAQPRESDAKLQEDLARAFNSGDPRRYVKAFFKLPYVIEPPDILAVQCISLIPNESYVPNPRDVVHITITGGDDRPNVDAIFQIAADGAIDLGKPYGQVHLAGRPVLFLKQYSNIAPVRILERQITKELGVEKVSIIVVTTVTNAEVSGQHLVAIDGHINLGVYGNVFVAGKTIDETRLAIEKKLREKADIAEVSVDVAASNSKVYYIITQFGGERGDDVVRAPITGNETVLDAIATLGGLPRDADVKMWVARPAPNGVGAESILPIAWQPLARGIAEETNYQLLPGDRLFIEPQPPIENPQTPPVPVGATEMADLVGDAWSAPVPKWEMHPILGPITSGAELVTLDPPSDDEVMRVREKSQPVWRSIPLLRERSRKVVRIVKEKIADYVDAPRDYPLVGRAQQHHAHYKCTIDYEDDSEVIYVDHNHLHMVENVDAGADNRQDPPPIPVENPQATPIDAPEAVHAAAYDRSAAKEGETRLEALKRQRAVLISLRMPDGRSVERSEQIADGATIGQVLNNVTFPYPVDLGKAQITVSRQDRVWMLGRSFEGQRRWTVGWDEAANTVVASDDNPLEPGDRISIDMSPPPASLGVQPNLTMDNSAAAPASSTRVGELQIHDVVTVLVDYGAKAEVRHPQSFRIACEITKIRPNGNLSIEGKHTIRNNDEQWQVALSGEVRRESIQPDRTVSSNAIVNLNIYKREVRLEASSVTAGRDDVQADAEGADGDALTEADVENRPARPLAAVLHGQLRFGPPAAAPVTEPKPTPDAVPWNAAAPLAPPPANVPPSGEPIECKLAIIEDVSGDLADFDGLGKNSIAVGDSSTILAALKVFQRHELVKTLADPVLRTNVGRGAGFNLGPDFRVATKAHIMPHPQPADDGGRALLLDLAARVRQQVVNMSFPINEGQSAIVKLHPRDGAPAGPSVYVVVTPEWLE